MEAYATGICFDDTKSLSDMTYNTKAAFLDYAYDVLDAYFDANKNSVESLNHDPQSSEFTYHKLFITLTYQGTIRGCQSGSTKSDEDNREIIYCHKVPSMLCFIVCRTISFNAAKNRFIELSPVSS